MTEMEEYANHLRHLFSKVANSTVEVVYCSHEKCLATGLQLADLTDQSQLERITIGKRLGIRRLYHTTQFCLGKLWDGSLGISDTVTQVDTLDALTTHLLALAVEGRL